MNELSAAKKLDLTLQFLRRNSSAEDFCSAHGISSTKTLYNWCARLRSSAAYIFRERRGAPRHTGQTETNAQLAAENAALQLRLAEYEDAPPCSQDANQLGLEASQSADDEEREREFLHLYGVGEREIEGMLLHKPPTERGRKSLRRTLATAKAKKSQKEPPAPGVSLE
jgi:transposase-like protein